MLALQSSRTSSHVVALTLPQAYAVTRAVSSTATAPLTHPAIPRSSTSSSTPQNFRAFSSSVCALRKSGTTPSSRKFLEQRKARNEQQNTQQNDEFPHNDFYRYNAARSRFSNRDTPGTMFGKFTFGKDAPPVPTYDLPPPPNEKETLGFLQDVLNSISKDPYVMASFKRFGMTAPSIRKLLLMYPSTSPLTSGKPLNVQKFSKAEYEGPLFMQRIFSNWCREKAATEVRQALALVKTGRNSSPIDDQKTARKTQLFKELAPIVTATRQFYDPQNQLTISLYGWCFHKFFFDLRNTINDAIAKAELAKSLPPTITSWEDHAHLLHDVRSALSAVEDLFQLAATEYPAQSFHLARTFKRQWHLHVGPTNSGKTYGALVRLTAARSGCYLGPLRLLAHEVWDRISRGTISPNLPARACALKTGEEEAERSEMLANGDQIKTMLTSSTIEMANLSSPVDVAVIDEIQMIGDPTRGSAWTDALLGIKAREIHICGEPTTVTLIQKLAADCGDTLTIHEYERLTPLRTAEKSLESDLSRVEPGDCVVAFSRSGIFAVKQRLEALPPKPGQPPIRCAVAYGGLPPEVRAEQARLFNEGVHANVMVASDAIGMGLNLKIKRIIFEQCSKFNGTDMTPLSASQIKQIAGRAGRFAVGQKSQDGGVVTCLHEEDMPILRAALASPKMDIDFAMVAPHTDRMPELRQLLPETELPGTLSTYEDSPFAAAKAKGLAALEGREEKKRLKDSRHEVPPKVTQAAMRMYSSTYSDMSLLCTPPTDHYCLADTDQQRTLSPIVNQASSYLTDKEGKPISSLTNEARDTFSKAPCNLRDPALINAMRLMVESYAKNGYVEYKTLISELKLDAVLEIVRQLKSEMRYLWDTQNPHRASDSASKAQEPNAIDLARLLPARSILRPHFLMDLESLHRIVMLYIWMSFRFPLAFLQRREAEEYSEEVESAIQFTLEGMRAGRGKRLQELGRDIATQKEDKRARRQANREKAKRRGGHFFNLHAPDERQDRLSWR